MQRVALALCLGKPADVYLIDEPSAYLDSEQRLHAAKVIKRFILHAKKTGFVVEHDFIMATYLADRVIVFEGTPSINTKACAPQSLLTGMNKFLEQLQITFRRDPSNFRFVNFFYDVQNFYSSILSCVSGLILSEICIGPKRKRLFLFGSR